MVVEGGNDHPSFQRSPRVLLTEAEISAAVEDLLREDAFVIDIETDSLSFHLNNLLWVGLGAYGRIYLIPCGHLRGVVLEPEHVVKIAACLYYPEDDERHWTPITRKPSWKMIDVRKETVYAVAPKQLFPHEVMALLRPLLFSNRGKIGHNLKFDLMSLAKYFGEEIPPGPYHDTIVLRHCLDENDGPFDLKRLTCDWFGIGVDPQTGHIDYKKRTAFYPNMGKAGIENFGLDEVARYLAKDLRYCWMMYQAFFPLLKRRGVQAVYDFEMSLYPIIMAMEYEGFPFDLSQMDEVRKELKDRQADVEQKVWNQTGDTFPLSNTNAKRWVMFEEATRDKETGKRIPEYGNSNRLLRSQKLPVRSRTPGQRLPQVTQTVLEYYSDDGNKMAELFLEWSLLEKLRGTFIDGLEKHLRYPRQGLPTIHTSFKQHGTVTGRLSASDPNLQQLPRGTVIRKLFVAGEGHDLIVADYDQIELRCAGYSSQDPEMLRVFKQGQDIHALAASAMLQIPLDKVTKEQRQVGKTQNFGTLYGAGEDKIAAVAGVSKKRAAAFIRNYFDMFSGLESWKRRELKLAIERGDKTAPLTWPPYVVIPPNGRRRRLPDLFHPDGWEKLRAERQAINAHVQGFASNITKLAMLELFKVLEPFPAQMIAQVHDEIVIRVTKEASGEVLSLVQSTMSGVRNPEGDPILGEIPLVVSAATGPSWADAKQ